MIQMQSVLDVADNTGARSVMCIKVLGALEAPLRRHWRRHQGEREGRRAARPREKGEIYDAVVVRTAKGVRRSDGSLQVRSNAAVLLTPKLEPIGTRIFGR